MPRNTPYSGEAETDREYEARAVVIAERKARRWSVRRAAAEGGIANQTWGNYEKSRTPLTDTIHAAVVRAFNWPENWERMPGVAHLAPDAALELGYLPGEFFGLAELPKRVTQLDAAVGRLHRALEFVAQEGLEASKLREFESLMLAPVANGDERSHGATPR